MQRERFESLLSSVMLKIKKENRDEISIQKWNEKIGQQFSSAANTYQRFFTKRGQHLKFKTPAGGSPA